MLMRKLSYILLLVKVTVTVRVCNELTIFLIEFKLLVLSAAVYPEAVTYAAPGSDNGRGVASAWALVHFVVVNCQPLSGSR